MAAPGESSTPGAADRPTAGQGYPGAQRDGDLSLSAARHIAKVALIVLATVALSLVVQLTFVSGLQHRAAQQRQFDTFRKELAEGTAPLGQTDSSGRLYRLGRPVAMIEIPSIRVHEIVGEGTTAGVLQSGPGHRRDTPLPGQAGTSIIMGRAAAYGGPFKRLHSVHAGATIRVTTQQAVSTFRVIGIRHPGDPAPPRLGSRKGRLTLMTATGMPFMPSGVLRVDANLVTPTQATPPVVLPLDGLPQSELALGTDTGTLWALVLWLQALVIVAVAIVWSWVRWGHQQTWIVFLPVAALVGFFVANQFARLLPNLL